MRFFPALLLTAPLLVAQMPPVSGTPTTTFSLRYIDVVVGTGAPATPGKQYTVHYTGWLTDGTQFDSSIGKKPLEFVQGKRQLIAGWETGFEGMKVGGKRRLFIPYQLAYGELGRPPRIPAKAELIFDVELLAVAEPTQTPAAVDVLLPLGDLEEKVSKLLKAVPEDKLDWRPAPGVRSFREVFLHIALANQLLLNIADNQPAMDALKVQIEANDKREHVKSSKEEIQKLLTDSFAAVRKSMEAAQTPGLGRDVKVFGTATTRRGAFTFLDVHAAEHMGQLIAYCRTNGITPPWSAGN
jgi:uncharacterized damage-inducible protein DinB